MSSAGHGCRAFSKIYRSTMRCQSPEHLGTRSMRGGTAPENQISDTVRRSAALRLGADLPQMPGAHGGGGLRDFL